MIQILTFFLSLTTGIHPVEFQVAGAVSQVEIYLDSTPIALLEAPPWSLAIDFGEGLAPHVLLAVAHDRQGREIDRAHRLINLDSAAHDPLPNSQALGFSYDQDLTAVVIELIGRHELPAVQEMDGWFLVRGQPAVVLQADRGSAEVVVVRDPTAQPWLEKLADFFLVETTGTPLPPGISGADLGRDLESFLELARDSLHGTAASSIDFGAAWGAWKNFMQTDSETRLRFLSPLAAPASTVQRHMKIFNISPPFEASTQGFLYHTTRIRPLEFNLRISDAVALAGLEAHASRKRCAVLALLTDVPLDRSRFRPEDARKYLKTLGIPLFVWSFGEPMPEWNATQIYRAQGRPIKISPVEGNAILGQAREAFAQLRRNLNQQRVVRLAGAHLPQDIELSPQATGLHLAGRSTPASRER